MKRVLCIIMAAMFMITGAQAGQYVVKIAHWAANNHPLTQSVDYFKEGLEKESNGAFSVQHYPNNTLGSEDVVIDQSLRGTIQIGITGTLIKREEPNVGMCDAPFTVDSWEHARAVYLEDPRGNQILSGKLTDKSKIRIAGFAVNGFREISSRTPVNNMAELMKLKLRVPNSDIFAQLFKALDVNGVMMPMPEIYNALETNVVDGQENPYPTIKNAGYWEVQKGILESRHIFSTAPVLVNNKFRDSLPEADRKLYDKWIDNLIKHNWDISEKADNEAKEFMEGKGVTITVLTPEFRKEIQEKLDKNFYPWFTQQFPATPEWLEYCKSKRK